jgi:hypothetical protein
MFIRKPGACWATAGPGASYSLRAIAGVVEMLTAPLRGG